MHLRLVISLLVCTLVLGTSVAQPPNADCAIAGRTQVACGTTGTWFGSLPVAVNPYSAAWSLQNNNTGAAIVGPAGCASITPPAGSCQVQVAVGAAGTFDLRVTLTAQSGAQKTCNITVTVIDTVRPVITCPPDVSVECNTSTAPAVTGSATATDCSPFTITHSDAAGASNCAGAAIVRTWTATDTSGNSSSCIQVITFVDTQPPSITCPGPVTVECDGDVPPADVNSVTVSDACSTNIAVIHVGDSSTGTCPKTITRTYRATDPCGNQSTCTQTITVHDVTPPVITCPPDITTTGTGCMVLDIGMATATDNCGGVTITNDAPVQFCVGETSVVWTATDFCGNTATCKQTITIGGGEICATKYYDQNANGVRDPGEPGIPGWLIIVTGPTNTVGVTGADGSVCFTVGAGTFTVSEGTPNEANWVHTTPTSQQVTPGSGTSSVSFGNYCFDAPSGGHTLGFWRNPNGKAILQAHDPAWRTLLNGLNLKNANGTDFVVPGGTFTTAFNAWSAYDQGATATNMAYMLSAQLAATTLSVNYFTLNDSAQVVVPGGMNVGGTCVVPFLSSAQALTCGATPLLALTAVAGSNACGCVSNDGLVTVSDLRARADCLLGAYPVATASGLVRTYEEIVKDLLDIINNNGSAGYSCGTITQFIHPASGGFCPHTFPN